MTKHHSNKYDVAARVAGKIKYRSEFHGLDPDDIYQVVYLAVLELWDENPDQKETYYFKTARYRAVDFAREQRNYDRRTKSYIRSISLTDDYPITNKIKEGIYGKQMPRARGVDEAHALAATESKPLHDLYKKPRCEPNCDGTCNALAEKEPKENIADPQSPTNCFICNELTHNIINVRYDVVYKARSRMQASSDSFGLMKLAKTHEGQLMTGGPIWKGICQDCFSK